MTTLLAVGISLKGRYILMDDDSTVPIVQMLDGKAQETEDPAQCVGVVFQRPNGLYSVVEMKDFDDEHMIDDEAKQ